MLACFPFRLFKKQQSVLNAEARLVFGWRKWPQDSKSYRMHLEPTVVFARVSTSTWLGLASCSGLYHVSSRLVSSCTVVSPDYSATVPCWWTSTCGCAVRPRDVVDLNENTRLRPTTLKSVGKPSDRLTGSCRSSHSSTDGEHRRWLFWRWSSMCAVVIRSLVDTISTRWPRPYQVALVRCWRLVDMRRIGQPCHVMDKERLFVYMHPHRQWSPPSVFIVTLASVVGIAAVTWWRNRVARMMTITQSNQSIDQSQHVVEVANSFIIQSVAIWKSNWCVCHTHTHTHTHELPLGITSCVTRTCLSTLLPTPQ